MQQNVSVQYHIHCKPGDVGRYVLLPGDPGRCALIAEHFDDAKLVARNREYTTFTGTLDGVPVSVTSTGIGCPSTAIALEELGMVGADTFIRVGTCGAMQSFLHNGDLVIAQAAVREEGTSVQYVPLSYPAVAHLDTVVALQRSAHTLGLRSYTGIVRSTDGLYRDLSPETIPFSAVAGDTNRMWSEARVLVSDAEASALFVVSSIRGHRAGAVLLVVNAVGEGPIQAPPDGSNVLDPLIRTSVGALRELIAADRAAQASG